MEYRNIYLTIFWFKKRKKVGIYFTISCSKMEGGYILGFPGNKTIRENFAFCENIFVNNFFAKIFSEYATYIFKIKFFLMNFRQLFAFFLNSVFFHISYFAKTLLFSRNRSKQTFAKNMFPWKMVNFRETIFLFRWNPYTLKSTNSR